MKLKPVHLLIAGICLIVVAFFVDGGGLFLARAGQYAIIGSIIWWIVNAIKPKQPPYNGPHYTDYDENL